MVKFAFLMKIRLKLKNCYLLKDNFPDFPVFPGGKWVIFPVSRREIENPGNVQLYSTQSHSLEKFSTISFLANQTEISTEPSSTNDDDERWWMVWVQLACLVLAAFGIMAKMFKKFKSCCKSCVDTLCVERGRAGQPNQEEEMSTVHNEEIVICYLCNKKVSVAQWNDRETGHRGYCAVKSKNHRGTLCSF